MATDSIPIESYYSAYNRYNVYSIPRNLSVHNLSPHGKFVRVVMEDLISIREFSLVFHNLSPVCSLQGATDNETEYISDVDDNLDLS